MYIYIYIYIYIILVDHDITFQQSPWTRNNAKIIFILI